MLRNFRKKHFYAHTLKRVQRDVEFNPWQSLDADMLSFLLSSPVRKYRADNTTISLHGVGNMYTHCTLNKLTVLTAYQLFSQCKEFISFF